MGRDGERREKPSVEIINTIWLRTQTHLLKDAQVNGEPSTFNREAYRTDGVAAKAETRWSHEGIGLGNQFYSRIKNI